MLQKQSNWGSSIFYIPSLSRSIWFQHPDLQVSVPVADIKIWFADVPDPDGFETQSRLKGKEMRFKSGWSRAQMCLGGINGFSKNESSALADCMCNMASLPSTVLLPKKPKHSSPHSKPLILPLSVKLHLIVIQLIQAPRRTWDFLKIKSKS